MGNVSAKNIVDSAINSTINVNTDIIQITGTETTSSQEINIGGRCRIKPGAKVANEFKSYNFQRSVSTGINLSNQVKI